MNASSGLTKNRGLWALTDEGRAAYRRLKDPKEFILESHRLYRQWADQQPESEEPVEAPATMAANAATTLCQSLDMPFDRQRQRFIEQWDRACTHILPLAERAGDGGHLYHVSSSLLLAHEDKRYQGQ